RAFAVVGSGFPGLLRGFRIGLRFVGLPAPTTATLLLLLGLQRLRRWRRKFGHVSQIERANTEKGDRRGGTVDAEQPAPGGVQAEPDLADRRSDDEHTGHHVKRDRGGP